jgi:hypothetical protein
MKYEVEELIVEVYVGLVQSLLCDIGLYPLIETNGPLFCSESCWVSKIMPSTPTIILSPLQFKIAVYLKSKSESIIVGV